MGRAGPDEFPEKVKDNVYAALSREEMFSNSLVSRPVAGAQQGFRALSHLAEVLFPSQGRKVTFWVNERPDVLSALGTWSPEGIWRASTISRAQVAGTVTGSGVAHGFVGPEGAHVCRPS